jgi:hypothetical protein
LLPPHCLGKCHVSHLHGYEHQAPCLMPVRASGSLGLPLHFVLLPKAPLCFFITNLFLPIFIYKLHYFPTQRACFLFPLSPLHPFQEWNLALPQPGFAVLPPRPCAHLPQGARVPMQAPRPTEVPKWEVDDHPSRAQSVFPETCSCWQKALCLFHTVRRLIAVEPPGPWHPAGRPRSGLSLGFWNWALALLGNWQQSFSHHFPRVHLRTFRVG